LDRQSPRKMREVIRRGEYKGPTPGIAGGYAQANLVILPRSLAYDFLLFCQRNPKPCPILEITDTGSFEAARTAPHSDLRTDVPKYRVYQKGELTEEVFDIKNYWTDELVSFLLGCSFTFEQALIEAGISMRHIDEGRNVPMYKTNIQCESAGVFSGPMVVSMRPIKKEQVVRAIQITSRYPSVHGAPIHIDDPKGLGIEKIDCPDFGESVTVKEGEVPVFWACGVTPQLAAAASRSPFMITHSPGHMFITDVKDNTLSIL